MRSPRVLPRFSHRYPINPEVSHIRVQPRQGSGGVTTNEHEWIVEQQRGVYQEVVRPERLVFTYAFEDDAGRPLHQTVVTISFADEEGSPRLVVSRYWWKRQKASSSSEFRQRLALAGRRVKEDDAYGKG